MLNSFSFDQSDVHALPGHIEATVVALVLAFFVWRIGLAVVDRFFARRFVSKFMPRVATFSSLTKSIAGLVIFLITILVLLNIWAVNVAPAVWSAGILTASLAFGAQWFVKDIIAGFSALLEDQYDVGDYVEILTLTNAVVAGTIESIGLRSTRLVDDRGRLVTVPNGNVQFVSNASRLPGKTAFTLALPWRADATAMRERIESYARAAADGAGLSAGNVAVSLVDAGAESATFRVEIRVERSTGSPAEHGVIEPIVARLQVDGWLPKGPPDPRPPEKETA